MTRFTPHTRSSLFRIRGDIAVTNTTLLRNPILNTLGYTLCLANPLDKAQRILGWGYKPSGLRARALARKRKIPVILAEDGFLTEGAPEHGSCQLILDTTGGMHYDPERPSLIDALLDEASAPATREQTREILTLIRTASLSKTNNRPEPTPLPDVPFILVCDQVEDDASLGPSKATPRRFRAMLQATRQTWPDHLIVVRAHPKANKGHLEPNGDQRTRFHQGTDHPTPWLKAADHVVVMSSQMGFEALIHGTPVTCWGTPFYAGRGLTRDIGAQPGYQRQQTDLEHLAGAALVLAPTSIHPQTGQIISSLDLATHFANHRANKKKADP